MHLVRPFLATLPEVARSIKSRMNLFDAQNIEWSNISQETSIISKVWMRCDDALLLQQPLHFLLHLSSAAFFSAATCVFCYCCNCHYKFAVTNNLWYLVMKYTLWWHDNCVISVSYNMLYIFTLFIYLFFC